MNKKLRCYVAIMCLSFIGACIETGEEIGLLYVGINVRNGRMRGTTLYSVWWSLAL